MALDCDGCPLEKERNAIPLRLSKNKPYTIVTKVPSTPDLREGRSYPASYGSTLKDALAESGLYINKDFNFIPPIRCSYNPDTFTTKDKRLIKKMCRKNMSEVLVKLKPDVIIPLGADATSAVAGRATKITKARGIPVHNEEFDTSVLPILDPSIVKVRPENTPLFRADVQALARFIDNDRKIDTGSVLWGDYKLVDDIGFIVDADPDILGMDAETMGFEYHYEDKKLLTLQFSYEEGKAYAVSWDHPESVLPDDKKKKMVRDLRRLVKAGTEFAGHNFKFDTLWIFHKLGVDIPIGHDTLLMYSLINENAYSKSLTNLTKMYLSELAGYDDQFNAEIDKGHMEEVSLDVLLNYMCADADAVTRLVHIFLKEIKKDPRLYNYYERVTIPGINAFKQMEKQGINVDVDKLQDFRGMLSSMVYDLRASLLNRVPRSIRRKHMSKGLNFTRGEFVRDILFSHKDGFKFTPQVFTDATKNLKDRAQRLPSTSTKQHLPYFIPHPFVEDLIEFIKLERMLGTNVVSFERKYVHPDGMLHPSHFMSTATTGRVSSIAPNVQNFPNRGELAKPYKEMFNAPEGYGIVAADYSQMELRIAAHEAREPEMIRIYNTPNGDIHAATAATSLGLTLEEFYELPKDEMSKHRFGAKGTNFGYLYAMMAKTYVSYAKTTYGIDVTKEEAEAFRNAYFNKYSQLLSWHEARSSQVRRDKQVRSVFGRVRHLPQIESDDAYTKIEAVRLAINSPVQSAGSDLGVMALARLTSELDMTYLYPRQFIHDAIYSYVPLQYMAWASIALKYYMESNPIFEWFDFDFSVPIVAEPEMGINQGKLVEVKTPDRSLLEITEDDLWYVDEYAEDLGKKGLILPRQEIPPLNGLKYRPRRVRWR